MEWNRRLTAWALAAAMMTTGVAAAAEGSAPSANNDADVVVAPIVAVPAAMAELPGLDSSYLVLPSQQEPLAADYVPQGLVEIVSRRNDADGKNANGGLYMASSQRMQMVDFALEALERMFVDAEREGVVLYIRQAYRSYADEERNTQRMAQRGEVGEVPGQSDWQTGLSVSVVPKALRTKTLTAEAFNATEEAKWLQANCARYGFVVRYPEGKSSVTGQEYQPWRLRYVGESAAAAMTERGMTLEELRVEVDVTGSLPVAMAPAATPAPEAVVTEDETPEAAGDTEPAEEAEVVEDAEIAAEETADEPAGDVAAQDAGQDVSGVDVALLVMASAAQPLDASYVPGSLQMVHSRRSKEDATGVYMASSQNMYLVDVALKALTEMFGAAEQEGLTLYLRQAYRSYEDENARYERMVAGGKADLDKPGQSDWQTGLAVTVVPKSLRTKALEETGYLKTEEGKWVTDNCAEYGFIIRYPQGGEDETGRAYEPWHLRYVGVSAARYITENDMTLEGFCRMNGVEALPVAETAKPVAEEAGEVPAGTPAPAAAEVPAVTAAPTAVPEPTAEPTPEPTSTPVPPVLPGGIELVGEGEDGDWEYSLVGD